MSDNDDDELFARPLRGWLDQTAPVARPSQLAERRPVFGRPREIEILSAAMRGEVAPHGARDREWVRGVLQRAMDRAVMQQDPKLEQYAAALEALEGDTP